MSKIVDCQIFDIRFPTSRQLDGSDAMNQAPDYSAAYVILKTEDGVHDGHGLTFTIGRGNELCCAAIRALAKEVVGRDLGAITADMAGFWRSMVSGDSQLRWLGPEKGVIHLATAALVNAVWDLWAKTQGVPLWRLLVAMSPQQLVGCVDFRFIGDALSPDEAVALLERQASTKDQRMAHLHDGGYPAYTTSAGWLGYDEARLRALCRQAVAQGWTHFKQKVGGSLDDDIRRAEIIRQEIGSERVLMMDANQVWDVDQAIRHMERLAVFKPLWIEEPTSPDDILGHAAIARALKPLGIGVATGEHCHNRVMFKQFFQAKALDYCQLDAARLGGVNEALAVILLAAKYQVPVCPHAGGVGLCEYVQHLSMFDYIAVSGSLEGRILEYVDNLHEHFLDPVVIKNARYMTPTAPGYC
ncbi:MAG: L-fuconate dehydratase, partial [Candidatus Competibacterales bacterium]